MSEPEVSLKLPVYCAHFEDLIVEEMAYCHNPAALHYGKVSVYGFLAIRRGKFFIQSLTISYLDP